MYREYSTEEDIAFELKMEAQKEALLNTPHPLINPDSPHYDMIDGVNAVIRLEQMYSKEELAIWANISAMKYRLRIGNKDNVEKEARKIMSFEAYYKYLTS